MIRFCDDPSGEPAPVVAQSAGLELHGVSIPSVECLASSWTSSSGARSTAVQKLNRRLAHGLEPLLLLDHDAHAAAAWTRTLLDCCAVEDYCFEPGIDPGAAH